jgi:hypothetical protein
MLVCARVSGRDSYAEEGTGVKPGVGSRRQFDRLPEHQAGRSAVARASFQASRPSRRQRPVPSSVHV